MYLAATCSTTSRCSALNCERSAPTRRAARSATMPISAKHSDLTVVPGGYDVLGRYLLYYFALLGAQLRALRSDTARRQIGDDADLGKTQRPYGSAWRVRCTWPLPALLLRAARRSIASAPLRHGAPPDRRRCRSRQNTATLR